ncbi:hypothetical protein [Streptomyces sp. NPDC051310]|uniref:hypothetical protein n=1 Tax=Streptomyces sp. NPDC051310 TaxID=3365649 RepID=UPI0037B050FD
MTINEEDLVIPDKPLPILKRTGIAREKQCKPRDFDHVAQVDDDTLNRFETVFKKLTA